MALIIRSGGLGRTGALGVIVKNWLRNVSYSSIYQITIIELTLLTEDVYTDYLRIFKIMNMNASNNSTGSTFLRWSIFFLIPLLFIFLCILNGNVLANDSTKRVIVLGFDGLDFNLVNKYMIDGKLPNLQRLKDRGVYAPLLSTNPAESPVAWASFVTGTNPGKTGIFDFLRRNPDTYFPELNMTDFISGPQFLFNKIPVKLPELKNCRQGQSFWGYAAEAGIKTTGIMMPMNMPPDKALGSEVLSGLGVPDMRRTMGTYVYFVDSLEAARKRTGSAEGTEMGGRVIEVERNRNTATAFIPGPFNPLRPGTNDELQVPVRLTIDEANNTVDFEVVNRSPFKFLLFFGGLLVSILAMLLIWMIFARILKSSIKGFLVALIVFLVNIFCLWLVSIPRQASNIVRLKEKQWSDWVHLKFLMTDWVGLEGFVKIYLIEAGPELQIYVTPVNIDPRGTKTDLSFPPEYAKDLLNNYGEFKTYGWDSETWALNENVLDEQAYIEDLLANMDAKMDMAFDQMKKRNWRIFASIFQATDHVQHMFWRFIDPMHPAYNKESAEEFGNTILDVYQRADRFVGKVMDEILDENDALIVMSDHGFNSFRKAVNINRWLVDNGYLAEKPSMKLGRSSGKKSSVYELFSRGSEFFGWVDWSKSKAYALGLGQIYINLEGREKNGIVTENERSELIDTIIKGLEEIRDPETGDRVIIKAYRADELYHGDNMKYAPDIVVGFAPGYRVSWQTTLGVAAENLIEINDRKWSGDHCSFDPSLTRGVFFSTEPITVPDPSIIDLTPSILSLVGIDKPDRCDGRIIF